ncbi:MAG: glycoside hydrolase family 15 protein, partial [Anaerolineales bacterium]
GELSGSAVAHGSVDSCIGFTVRVPAKGVRTVYSWLAAGGNFESVAALNRTVRRRGPEHFLQRTRDYWRLWLQTHRPDFDGLPAAVGAQYLRSLLTIRTQADAGGAILAANDTDISTAVRDTYSYMWPRDGALVARALTQAGYIDLPRHFFQFCSSVIAREGFLLHKYNPDGTLASSWHPWYRDGHKSVPLQEDETALVLWALWEHFQRFGDVEFVKPLYRRLVIAAAEFLVQYTDSETGLPHPSYDLWEERWGVLGWTVAATWAGLTAAANFAGAFGDSERMTVYREAANRMRAGVDAVLWRPDLNRFARMVLRSAEGGWQVDETIDASLGGLWLFGVHAPDDPKVKATMGAIRDRLWVRTEIGGLARYEDDRYHQVSRDIVNIAGNPWIICTLWLAEWYAAKASKPEDLDPAAELLGWATERALPSGVLAEQVNPYTGAPLSVSPLTWSHAAFVSATQAYLRARDRINKSPNG